MRDGSPAPTPAGKPPVQFNLFIKLAPGAGTYPGGEPGLVLNLFEPYCTKDLKFYCKFWEDKKTKQIYEFLFFVTIALLCFNKYR
jgi:hypothetical protein